MDVVEWAKENKVAAAAIGAGGLFLVLHRGNAANSADVTSSDSTVAGAPADGEHVQLIPVSSGADLTDPSNGGSDGISDTSPIIDPNNPNSDGNDVGFGQIPGGVNVGGDLNSPILPPANATPVDNSDIINAINQNGAAVSGTIAALAATNAATRPVGHPGYKTVVKTSAKYGGAVVYHERLSDHKLIPVRPASTAAAAAVGAKPAPAAAIAHPAAAPSSPPPAPKPTPKAEEAPAGYPHKGPHGWYRDERDKRGRYHLYQNGMKEYL